MEVIRRETIDLEYVAALHEAGVSRHAASERNRSVWHVTDLLYAGRSIIKGGDEYPERVLRPTGIMSLGRIWETVVDSYLFDYAGRHGGRYTPDVVLDKDGVSGSLDGVMVFPELAKPLVCECKLTFTLDDAIPMNHQHQMRAYCHLADTPLACYITGHIWSDPPMATALLRFIRFSKLDIRETWLSIVNTKRYLEKKGLGPGSNIEEEGQHESQGRTSKPECHSTA